MHHNWVYHGTPTDPGRWVSADGRWTIRPLYIGTGRAQQYALHDAMDCTEQTADTVRQAKELADLTP